MSIYQVFLDVLFSNANFKLKKKSRKKRTE